MAEKWEMPQDVLREQFLVRRCSGSAVFHLPWIGEEWIHDRVIYVRLFRAKCGVGIQEILPLAQARKLGLHPCKNCMPWAKKWKWDPTAPRIEDVVEELGKEVPQEEWDKVPTDLTDNLD